MRKLLSFVLALALVASVFVGVTIVNAEDTVVGFKITALDGVAAGNYIRKAAGITADDVTWVEDSTGDGTENTILTGSVNFTYTAINAGSNPLTVKLFMQGGDRGGLGSTLGWDTITGQTGRTEVALDPNKAGEIVINVPVYKLADGTPVVKISQTGANASITNGVTGYAPLSSIYIRFDIVKMTAGDAVVFAAPAGDPVYLLPGKSGALEVSTVTELPTIEEDPEYVAVKMTNVEAISGDVFCKTVSGVISAGDVVDGKITRTYTIYNPCENAYNVMVSYQTTHTPDGGTATWAGTTDTLIPLAPGEVKEITIEIPVVDGKIEVGGKQYGISTFFFRVDMRRAADAESVPADSVLYVLAPMGDALYDLAANATYTVERLEEAPVLPTPAPTAEPTPTPVPVKKIENLNAEAGLVGGWGTIHGGSIELVQPGANGTGNAVKATISGKYHSLAYDLGPAIIQAPELGYQGAGTGIYVVKFWAKAEEGFEGKFSMNLNSQCHVSAAQAQAACPDLVGAVDTYKSIGNITLTDEWEEYEIEFEVPEAYLNTVYALYKSAHSKAASAYQLMLRFDGSGTGLAFNDEEYFSYYVDEISLQAPTVDTPEDGGEDVKVPTGVIFEATEDNTTAYIVTSTAGGAVTPEDIDDGQVTKYLYIENLSDEDMSVKFSLQALAGGKWVAPDASTSETWEIAAGATEKIEFTFEVNDDNTVTIKDEDIDISKLFYRFDFTPSEFIEGAKFVVYGDETQVALFNATNKAGWTKTLTYEAPKGAGTGDVAPVALVATVAVAFVALAAVVVKKRRED